MCMVEMAIFNIQRAITLKVGKQELQFMCSACHLMMLTFVSSFMKICQVVLKLWSGKEIVNTQRAITPKLGKPQLRFMCSALPLMVFNICVKFYENMSSHFKVMERTQKLLIHKGQ